MTLIDKLNQLLSRDGVQTVDVKHEDYFPISQVTHNKGVHAYFHHEHVTKLESTIRALIPVVEALYKINAEAALSTPSWAAEEARISLQNLESAVGK